MFLDYIVPQDQVILKSDSAIFKYLVSRLITVRISMAFPLAVIKIPSQKQLHKGFVVVHVSR